MKATVLCLFAMLCTGVRAQTVNGPRLPEHELDHRIALATQRLLDTTSGHHRPAFTHEFILADVDLDPDDPRRFDNFSGDLSGRYLEVVSLLNLVDRDPQQIEGLGKLTRQLLAQQQEDGRFGKSDLRYTADEIGGEHMAQLWGNGRLLVGLMYYYELMNDEVVLQAARRLGDFFIGTAEESRQPEIAERLRGLGAQGIICFSQYAEGLVMLAAATGDGKYAAAAEDAYTALPAREEVHTHGYLTTLRGALMLYELDGRSRHLDFVRMAFDSLLASTDYTRYGAVFEYFGGHGERDEGCSSADFVRLAFHLYGLTGEERYLEITEFGLLNALFNNQYANGDFGNHFFSESSIEASNPRRAWWCCTMHGLRALLEVKHRSLEGNDDGHRLLFLVTQHYDGEDAAFTLTHAGGNDEGERYHLEIERWADGTLTLRSPLHTQLTIEGETGHTISPRTGRRYIIKANYARQLVTDNGEARRPASGTAGGYLRYGPYVMGVNQEDFTAEPDWGHRVDWERMRPGELPLSLTTAYLPGGYPGEHPVTLVPMAHQMYFGHPFYRINTRFTVGK